MRTKKKSPDRVQVSEEHLCEGNDEIILHVRDFYFFFIIFFPANSVVRNKRPQMMRPTGSHSTYHALRGQTIELECIVQGL